MKFADIIARHEVLYGPDPFVGLSVSREAALHRLLQVLVNLHCGCVKDTRCRLPMTNNWRGSGARIAPRDALRQVADETRSAAALAAISAARESGCVPAKRPEQIV